jgi:hypothetical protein
MAKSTVSTILKNREAIKAADVVKGVKSVTSKRQPAVEEVENFYWFGLMKNSWLVIVCLRLLFQRKLDFCIATLCEIPLALVLKNLRLVKGDLTILEREQGLTVWLGMEKLPVQIKMLLKNLWTSLKTLWIERDLFPNKYSIVTRQASSEKKMPERTYITREEKRLVFMEYVSPSKQ